MRRVRFPFIGRGTTFPVPETFKAWLGYSNKLIDLGAQGVNRLLNCTSGFDTGNP